MGDTGCASAKLVDMLMMVSLPGTERTEAEWRALHDAAGLSIESIATADPRSGRSVIASAPGV